MKVILFKININRSIGPQKSLKQVISYIFGELVHFLKAQKIVFCKYLRIQ
jgi:hypothetical protein